MEEVGPLMHVIFSMLAVDRLCYHTGIHKFMDLSMVCDYCNIAHASERKYKLAVQLDASTLPAILLIRLLLQGDTSYGVEMA